MEDYRNPYGSRGNMYDPIALADRSRPKRSGGPVSGSRGMPSSAHGGRDPPIRIYVTLKKAYEGDEDYKKLSIMTHNNMYIAELKRKVEKEFVDLFPSEPPYIVAKIEDEKGFSLSNNSLVGEFLQHGDRIYAQPEGISEIREGQGSEFVKGLHGGGNTQDLLEMLKNLQSSVVAKLAASDLHLHEDVEDLLTNIINLGFSVNATMIHNICTILSKVLTPFTVQVYDKETNRNIQDLTILLIQYWLNEICQNDTYLMTHTVLIIENLIQCPALWELLKGSPIVARLLSLSKSSSATGETKSKIIRIVTNLSKDSAPVPPPEGIPRRSKYEDVNIRLYNNGEDTKPYIPDTKSSYSRQRMEPPSSYGYEPERRKPEPRKEFSRDNLRKVGYDAIHQGSRGKPLDYNRMEDQKYSEFDIPPRAERPMNSHTEKLNKNMFDKEPRFEDDYQFPLDGGARREPLVKIPFNDNLLHDYWCMLDKENNRDINIFAIQSLEPLIKDWARLIAKDQEKLLSVFNLVELFTMPFEIQEMQFKILDAITNYISETSAKFIIEAKGVSRIVKAYNYHSTNYQSTIAALLDKIWEKGINSLDIPTVVSVALCPHSPLQNIGLWTLSKMSDNAADGNNNLDSEFENHIPFLFEAYNTTKNMSNDAKNHLLQTLANLSIRDYLRPIIMDHKGLKIFLDALRNPLNVEGQRISAKGLVNLTAGKREVRLTVVSEITDEIKALYKNALDPVVGAYIQTMIHPDNK
jgi:hypothetical protein